ncbi:MAG: filamentous hemagglutinin N-terminal domain-containing protein [Cyanobacteria bacterium P01_E01_bin.35]
MTEFWSSNIQVTTVLSAINNCHEVNKRSPPLRLKFLCSLAGWCLVSSPISAQVTPDGTLGTDVNTSDNVTEITGGTKADSNLFHSFQDFSLGTEDTAFFNNGLDIKNIISRVTGNNISNIDGLIRANGSANLILLNPRGISFGANASLDIGGSFLGSTAESVIFEDGTVLNTDTVEPLITISAPIGLQLGQNSAAIEVSGSGHDLSVVDPLFSPIIFGEQSGIRVKPGQTLALLGGGITINGGVVAAPGGKIELGSVAEGIVDLDLSDSQLSLNYENVTTLENIELRSQGLADASGTESIPGGSIQVQGRQLSLNDGSLLLVQNQTDGSAGAISVDISESVTVSGTNNNGTIRSSITNETLGTGEGGDIKITTSQLTVDQGAAIVAKTLQPGNAVGGDVEINAAESVQVIGSSSINPSVTSSIAAASFGAGDSGNSTITTDFLNAIAGGTVVATALGTGNGGNLNIAANRIEVVGIEPNIFAASALTASTLSEGNAGNLTISTSILDILAGGRVDSSTIASGDAGNLKITAADSITIDGTVTGSLNPSLISSAANIVDPSLQEVLQLPAVPNGNSGSITIDTPRLNVTNGALITTSNDGAGNSGSISIDADSIWINNNSAITSQVGVIPGTFPSADDSFSQPQIPDNISFDLLQNLEEIQGGDITISTQELIVEQGANIFTGSFNNIAAGNIVIDASENVLVKGFSAINPSNLSFISTSTFGATNSGNINLSTSKLTVLDGARVAAGTFGTGSGGDINIQATESVEVRGVEPSQSVASLVGASSLGVGDAGNLNLDTTRLLVRDGGRVDSSAAAIGSAGDVNIQAVESIEVSGQTLGTSEPSRISSGVNIEDEIAQQIFQLPEIPSGDAGSVIVVTEDLQIKDRGEISVINSGLGDGGRLEIGADTISLDRQGVVTAATQSGEGGNILLDADNVIWQGNSLTTATAAGNGNGGNITINADTLVALEGSQITADAFMGMGGNIKIETEGLIICESCQVSASSELGIDGVVDIETLEPTAIGILEVVQQPTKPQEEVAVACPANRGASVSQLTITGRGGLPNRPQEMLNAESMIEFDTGDNSAVQEKLSPTVTRDTLPPPARSWYQDARGTVVLTPQATGVSSNNLASTPDCLVP